MMELRPSTLIIISSDLAFARCRWTSRSVDCLWIKQRAVWNCAHKSTKGSEEPSISHWIRRARTNQRCPGQWQFMLRAIDRSMESWLFKQSRRYFLVGHDFCIPATPRLPTANVPCVGISVSGARPAVCVRQSSGHHRPASITIMWRGPFANVSSLRSVINGLIFDSWFISLAQERHKKPKQVGPK